MSISVYFILADDTDFDFNFTHTLTHYRTNEKTSQRK